MFWVLRLHTDQQINYRLDSNQYDPGETVELKIAVTLPYPIYKQEFQRVDGRFEHEGEFYKLVKQKYEHDTLYIVCIRDRQTRELVKTMNDYVEMTQANPPTDQKAWSFLSKLMKDFYSHEGISILHQYGFSMPSLFGERPEFFLPPLIPVHAPPPKG